ncbi:hypothetical protein PH552_28950 [Rhizobium sp. CNPSo 3968]|uniref:hypothetical protein n=1 Tax=Rhizobium sp. CNPSo 3968 TaxID=3021408 RepID=UPI00254E85A9|nr:hypothetical protein [Rhizobium sp. CNPSo 3968]MDK4723388.1 hypothetical protein [Rhizobium sp. CNPSo 3968]
MALPVIWEIIEPVVTLREGLKAADEFSQNWPPRDVSQYIDKLFEIIGTTAAGYSLAKLMGQAVDAVYEDDPTTVAIPNERQRATVPIRVPHAAPAFSSRQTDSSDWAASPYAHIPSGLPVRQRMLLM